MSSSSSKICLIKACSFETAKSKWVAIFSFEQCDAPKARMKLKIEHFVAHILIGFSVLKLCFNDELAELSNKVFTEPLFQNVNNKLEFALKPFT